MAFGPTSHASIMPIDANGNVTGRNGYTVTWTSYDHPSLINSGSESVQFAYNHNHERWRAIYSGTAGAETTYFVGGLLEKVNTAGANEFRHFIFAGGAQVAVYSRTSAGAITLHYLREDHQGSVAAILNSDGTSYAKESFTAFGNRRSSCTWSGTPTNGSLTAINAVTRHGYTWHTALGAMGLNDMNGRIQDAVTGRFLSPDPYIPSPGNTQSYNRYSYVMNSPLTLVDPSGFAEKTAEQKQARRDANNFYNEKRLAQFGWTFPLMEAIGQMESGNLAFPWASDRYPGFACGYCRIAGELGLKVGRDIPMPISSLARGRTEFAGRLWEWQSGTQTSVTPIDPANGDSQTSSTPGRLVPVTSQGQSWWNTPNTMPFCGRLCALLGQRPTENTATNGQRVMNVVNAASIVTAGLGALSAAGEASLLGREIQLADGFYQAEGSAFKFSAYYYEKLWATGRGAPFLQAEEVLATARTVTPDRMAGFYRYTNEFMEMVYNPTSKEVWHLMPLPGK